VLGSMSIRAVRCEGATPRRVVFSVIESGLDRRRQLGGAPGGTRGDDRRGVGQGDRDLEACSSTRSAVDG